MTNLLEYNGTSVYCSEIHYKAVPVLFERIFNLEIIAVYNGFYKGKAKACRTFLTTCIKTVEQSCAVKRFTTVISYNKLSLPDTYINSAIFACMQEGILDKVRNHGCCKRLIHVYNKVLWHFGIASYSAVAIYLSVYANLVVYDLHQVYVAPVGELVIVDL